MKEQEEDGNEENKEAIAAQETRTAWEVGCSLTLDINSETQTEIH